MFQVLAILALCSSIFLFLILFYSSNKSTRDIYKVNIANTPVNPRPDHQKPIVFYKANASDDAWDVTVKNVKAMKGFCGKLCDTDKPATPGQYLDEVVAPVDCKRLVEILDRFSDISTPNVPPALDVIPDELKNMFSYNGR